MTCEYTINNKTYSEQDFKDFLATGGLDSFLGNGVDLSRTKSGEFKTREFVNSVRSNPDIRPEVKSALTGERTQYEVLPNDMTLKEANAIVDSMGVDEARKIVTSKKSVSSAVRVALGEVLIKRLNSEGRVEEAVDLVEEVAEIGTEYAQGLQAFSLFSRLSLDGQLMLAVRNAKKTREKQLESPISKTQISSIKKAVKKAKKEAVEQAIESVKSEVKATVKPNPTPRSYGSSNKIVSKKKYEEAKNALKTKMFSSVVPPPELIEIGVYHIEAGARDFASFAKKLVEDFGERVTDYLEETFRLSTDKFNFEEKENLIDKLEGQFNRIAYPKPRNVGEKKTKEQKLIEIASELDSLLGNDQYTKLAKEINQANEEKAKKKLEENRKIVEENKKKRAEENRIKSLQSGFFSMMSEPYSANERKLTKAERMRQMATELDTLFNTTAYTDQLDSYEKIITEQEADEATQKQIEDLNELLNPIQQSPKAAPKTRLERMRELATDLDSKFGTNTYTAQVDAYEQGKIKQSVDKANQQKLDSFNRLLNPKQRAANVPRDQNLLNKAAELDAIYGGTTYTDMVNTLLQQEQDQKDSAKARRQKIREIKKAKSESGIFEGLRDMGIDVQTLIRKHYLEQDQVGKDLASKLSQVAGLSPQAAQKLADIIERNFKQALEQKQKAALSRVFTKKQRAKPEVKKLEQKIIDLVNLGAFDEATLKEEYANALGFAKITPENAAKIKQLAEKIDNSKTERERSKAIQDLLDYQGNLKGVSFLDMAQALWISFLLSGPITQAINIIANAYNTVSLFTDAFVQNPKDARFLAKGLFVGLKRGLFEGADALLTGRAPIRDKVEISNILERTKFTGLKYPLNAAKYVSRFMKAADIVFFEGLRQMRSYQSALKMAQDQAEIDPSIDVRNKALKILNRDDVMMSTIIDQARQEKEDTIANIQASNMTAKEKNAAIKEAKYAERFRIYELTEAYRPSDIKDESRDFAVRGTFNQKPEGVLGVLSENVNNVTAKVKIAKFVVPFVNVISNVANNLIENSPLGFVGVFRGDGTMLGINARQLTDQQKLDLKVKAIKGTMIMTIAYLLTQMNDDDDEPLLEVTSNGFGDFNKNKDLEEQGWRPYSFRFKNPLTGEYSDWISYKDTPFALGLSYIGNTNDYDKYRKAKKDDAFYTKSAVAATGMVRLFASTTFLNSGESFLGSILDPRNESVADEVSKWAKKTATSMVSPSFFTQSFKIMNDAFDVNDKEVRETLLGNMLSSYPVARDGYEDQINGFGEPVSSKGDIVFSPNESSKDSRKLWDLLIDKKQTTSPPNRKAATLIDANGEEKAMTDQEFYKFSKIRGGFIKEQLDRNYDKLKDLDEKEFEKVFNLIKSTATTVGKTYIDKEIPKDASNFWSYISNDYKQLYGQYQMGDDSEETFNKLSETVKVFQVIPKEHTPLTLDFMIDSKIEKTDAKD